MPAFIGCLLLQIAVVALFLLFVGENEVVAGAFVSQSTWLSFLSLIGSQISRAADGVMVSLPFGVIGLLSILLVTAVNIAPSLLTRLNGSPKKVENRFFSKTFANTLWTVPIALWSVLWILNFLTPGAVLTIWLVRTVQMAFALTLAGWLWESTKALLPTNPGAIEENTTRKSMKCRLAVGVAMLVYVLVFVAMNFGLWFNLQIPHGDSSMYEEHLWNTLHGKGFRSYLDQGLFLGEHVQVVHLLLLPIYALWPSHLCLEMCGSIASALGAIPVFLIAKRYGKSELAAALVSIGYLLAFPLQYLDIAVDLKTFRPSAFGIPALLFAILFAEQKRWIWMTVCFAIALASQEDFAVVIAPFGLWLAVNAFLEWRKTKSTSARNTLILGGLIAVVATVYVFTVVKVVIPWFRSGTPVHYVSYFEAFGTSPFEIVWNLLTRPDLVGRELVTSATLALLLHLFIPYGTPYRAWSRLLVGFPLFVLLAANQLTREFPGPFHHFHAPMLPILGWAAASQLGLMRTTDAARPAQREQKVRELGLWVCCCAVTTGLFFSISPLGIKFWDSGNAFYWKLLYVPDERATEFAKIPPLIPQTARVASTDFVHPRFTHYERSYDYSHYPRRVADYEDKVPDDTDYIVIDTKHRYSEIQRFEEMREYRNQRDQWEQVPVDTKGYFIVLKRVRYPDAKSKTEEVN